MQDRTERIIGALAPDKQVRARERIAKAVAAGAQACDKCGLVTGVFKITLRKVGAQRICQHCLTPAGKPVCSKCGRFVRADESVMLAGEHQQPVEPNATCKKCGRVGMPFEGFI